MKQYVNYDPESNLNNSIYYYFRYFLKKIEFIFLILLSLAFIFLSKNHDNFKDDISEFFVNISLPASKTIAFPFAVISGSTNYLYDLTTANRQNIQLRVEIDKLKSAYIKVLDIKEENKELKDLMNFIRTKNNKYKTVRLIAKPNQTYGSNIIINAGKNQGIEENNIVSGRWSVIGRVVNVGANISQILMIDDENSKIPVITSSSRQRGVLVGNGNNMMTIQYLPRDHKVKIGDLVFTSGDGEHLPPSMFVGTVISTSKRSAKVKTPHSTKNTNLAVISKY